MAFGGGATLNHLALEGAFRDGREVWKPEPPAVEAYEGYATLDEEIRVGIADVFAVRDIIYKMYRQTTPAVSGGTIAVMAIA